MKIYVGTFKPKKKKNGKKNRLQNISGSEQVTLTKAGREYLEKPNTAPTSENADTKPRAIDSVFYDTFCEDCPELASCEGKQEDCTRIKLIRNGRLPITLKFIEETDVPLLCSLCCLWDFTFNKCRKGSDTKLTCEYFESL